MSKILNFDSYKIDRSKYEFKTENALLHDEYGNLRLYFCIVLIDIVTGDVVAHTGLEKYVVDLSYTNSISESTHRYAMSRVKNFLNYIIHETNINALNEITVNEIRGFLIKSRTDESDNEIKSESFGKIKTDIFNFLENYYKYHRDEVEFGYNGDDLRKITIVSDANAKKRRKSVIKENKALYVKAPNKNDSKRRNRVIMYGHLKALLYAAKKYDPMTYLPIMIMAYSGLRIGALVNITFEDISVKRRLGVLERITVEARKPDRFRTGKSHKGSNKKIRTAEVYTDFLSDVAEAIEFHKDYLQAHGWAIEGENPCFINKYGGAISATTLSDRIRALFYDHFIDILRETSTSTEFEGETYAYIDYYEEEYPGAHMFRHWFTMYLIAKKNLEPAEVRKWRGDAPGSDSYEEYIHINSDLIEKYKTVAYSFQEQLLADIYD